jgi:tetratricopeptide (TPR) repeat protein
MGIAMPYHIVGLMNRKNQSRHVLSDIKIGYVVLFQENKNTNTIDVYWKLRNEFLGSIPKEHEHLFRQGMRYGSISSIYGEIVYNFNIICIEEMKMLTLLKIEEGLNQTKREESNREKERLKKNEKHKEKVNHQIKEDESRMNAFLNKMDNKIESKEEQLTHILNKIKKLDSDQTNDISLKRLLNQLSKILLNSIEISRSTESILGRIVVAYLNVDDVSNIIGILEQFENDERIELTKLLSSLKLIQLKQEGIHINDITDPYLLTNLAKLHKNVKSYKRAYSLYKKSYAINPQNSHTLNGLGAVCKSLALYEEGVNYYFLAYKIKGNKTQVTNTGLGALISKMSNSAENYSIAEDLLLDALRLEESPYTHNALGGLYFKMDGMGQSRAAFLPCERRCGTVHGS